MDLVLASREKKRRILVAVWAYAYDALGDCLVDDSTYDQQAALVKHYKDVPTGHSVLDAFFRAEDFDCASGSWVYDHPELYKVKITTQRVLLSRANLHNRQQQGEK